MEREIGTAFGEQAFSDVVIKYSGQELKAHKIILCTRSKYFESAFGEGGRFKESKDGVLELHGDNPMALERLFRYIYSARYPIEIPDNDKDLNVAYWMDTLELAIVADKYCLPTLSQLVADHLEGLASERAPDLEDEQKLALFKLLATSGFGSKATDSFVLKLCWTIQTFRNCLMDEHFRILLGQRLALRDKLCSEHTVEALDVPEFRSLLRSDDSLAMKCLKNTMKDLDGWENDDGDAAVKCLDSLCYLQGWYDKKEWSQLQSQ